MRKEYDFSNAMPNPYIKKLRKQVAVKIDAPIVDYFKKQANILGMAYQSLISMYLADCIANKKTATIAWK
ncbi:MAG: BrnA antitoxin family protein [Treponema sp.]|jgi:predicted DNA binding CopG/RHH family protein|nr:BrnA antitoxin family protein [Treponema sp.]